MIGLLTGLAAACWWLSRNANRTAPRIPRWPRHRRSRRPGVRDLANDLDLLALSCLTGLSLEQALRLAAVGSGRMGPVWRACLTRYDGGLPLYDSLSEGLRPLGAAAERVSRTLRQGEVLGAPVAETLQQQAQLLRRQHRQEALRWAASVPMKLTLIAIGLLLPPVLTLVLIPALLGFFRDWQ